MSTAAARKTPSTPVAIVGMACIFPQAPDLKTYWNNILQGVDAIGEPLEAWGAERYLNSGRIKTQSGGFLRELYRFDATEFGIMPNSINGSEPDQFLALRVARDALADAGYARPEFDHSETGIVLGHSTYLHRGQGTLIQQNIVLDQTLELLQQALPHLDADTLQQLRAILQKKLPPTNADTVPGLVPNVMTGRIANRLNLRGPNYLLDAACSSSLLAVGAAIDELHLGRSRMMIAGGVNATLPAEVTTIFTQLGALSTRRKVRPFSVGSDGTLLGEGLGAIVLKRLEDALADDDRIYAVIRGVGQSSDGRGSGLLAPSHEGETLAIRRTYEMSATDPASIGLFEAHGTGIPLGDQTEIQSIKAIFGERSTPHGVIALGSVKSMISHCIPAAGIAGLIKMALSVHHKVLPPTLCDEVNPALGIDKTPFYVNTRVSPWIARSDRPRRAAVNAFGFGGTNAHAILEEAPTSAKTPKIMTAWPVELCVLSADSAETLANKLDGLAQRLNQSPGWQLPEVAAALATADRGELHRIAFVVKDLPGLVKALTQSSARLQAPANSRWPTRGGVAYAPERVTGKLAFLFPGEGSQYLGMFSELALCFPEVRQWLDFWHGLHDLPAGLTRTDIAFPTPEITPSRRSELEREMHAMDVGSEAVYIGGLAMHALLISLGVSPDVMLGHSSGESAALSASGANPAADFAAQAECISRHFSVYKRLLDEGKIPTGALLAVGALDRPTVEAHLPAYPDVEIAMDNCTNQMVLYGLPSSIARLQDVLSKLGGVCLPLPFDRGYHTSAFAAAGAAFLDFYKDIRLGPPKVPLYSCASAELFPDKTAGVRKLAAAQWATKVRFRDTIQKMHQDGVNLFMEVGPSANLTTFVQDILKGQPFVALPTNVRRRGDVEQLLNVLGSLYVSGRGPDLEKLFGPRAIAQIDLDSPTRPRGIVIDNTMPMIRLSPTEADAIRALVAPRPSPSAAIAPQMVPAAATPVVEHAASEHHERVMGGYLEVMRQFLTQQHTIVEQYFEADGNASQSSQAQQLAESSTHATNDQAPLLDEVIELDANHVVARCNISMVNDRFVRDHVMTGPVSETDPDLFGLSCVPLAVSLEMMAEACALLAGRSDVSVIENVRAFDWIALDADGVSIDVRAETIDHAGGTYRASVSTVRGTALTAEFRFAQDWRLAALPALVEPRASCWNAPDLYSTGMFHGPVFQSMRFIEGWDDTGVDVQLTDNGLRDFFTEGHSPRLILNPVLLDAFGQVVACWLVQFFGTEFNNFPSTIERIELYQPSPRGGTGIVMRARQKLLEGASTDPGAPRTWDFECLDGEGRALFRGHGMLNVFWKMPSAYHAVRWRPLLGWLGQPATSGTEASGGWQVPWLPTDFLTQSGAICLRTLAHVMLGASEREEWRLLAAIPAQTRIEWLFDRAAIKECVRHWIHEQTGTLLYPTDVEVYIPEQGEPTVTGWWCESLIAAPSVTLTRSTGMSRAAIEARLGPGAEIVGSRHRPESTVQLFARSWSND